MSREICTLVNSICNKPKLVTREYLFIKDKSSSEFKETFNCKGRAITLLENEKHILKNLVIIIMLQKQVV